MPLMSVLRKVRRDNAGVAHGDWGEGVAADYLRRAGFVIIERNARPCGFDRRLEIDLIVYDRASDTMVFVEVKQHRCHSPYERRMRSVNRRKLRNLRTACNAWRRVNKYFGVVRFDIIEIYGEPDGGRPEIDHLTNVNLFVKPERFVKWTA